MKKDGLNEQPEDVFYGPGGIVTLSLEDEVRLLQIQLENLKRSLELQGDINLKMISSLQTVFDRIETLEENGHKPNALILPPGLNS